MKKLIVFFIIGIVSDFNLFAKGQDRKVKYEVRAAWLTTLGGLDWPHSYSNGGYGSETQKKDLRDILDRYVESGINTVLFQTRVRGTVAYPSEIEPWESSLSGKPGVSPGYDVLQYAIEECHKRGLRIHAWVVAIPLGKWNGPGCQNLRKKSPGILKKIGDEGFMNPENKVTADYMARLCHEIVSKYDIDGIHLDYIRYPETWGKIRDKKYARDCITNIVRTIHAEVKRLKPWVAVSCSPVGKYADTKRTWAHGWNARDAVCQDAALWLKEGIMDILFPMMYFKGENFYPFVVDWQERSNGRLIVPGLGIYFLHQREKNWPLEDITREMNVCRQQGMGICFFRSKFFTDNTKGLYDYTKHFYSQEMSLQPPLTWLSDKKPHKPHNIGLEKLNNGNSVLRWEGLSAENDVTYNIYGSDDVNVDTGSGANLLLGNYAGTSIELPKLYKIRYFAVTSVDRYGNESDAVQTIKTSESVNNENHTTGFQMLNSDEKYLYLDSCDVSSSQVIEICSMVGNAVTSRFVRYYNSHLVADISTLPMSNYKVYVINRKGNRHLLGYFRNILLYR